MTERIPFRSYVALALVLAFIVWAFASRALSNTITCDNEPWMWLTTQNPVPVITPAPDYHQVC